MLGGGLNDRGGGSLMQIELEKITKSWGEVTAVDHVSFTAPEGRLLVVLGPSGCGKSTLLRLIAGLETVTGGVIRIGGRAVTDLPPARPRPPAGPPQRVHGLPVLRALPPPERGRKHRLRPPRAPARSCRAP